MKTLNRIAKPCGIAGGVWSILLAIIYSFFLPTHTVITTTTTGQSSIITTTASESWDWLIIAFIILTALVGLLGLLAVIMRTKNLGLGQWFIRVSAITMLVLSLVGTVTMVSVGIILFPAAILLILAAIGMGKKAEAVPAEAS